MFSQVTQISSIYQLPPAVDSLQWCKIPSSNVNISAAENIRDDVSFDRLLPTLFECFVVVFCGFLAGKCNLISQSDIKGLNDFTTYFTLPPLIFLNLVTINFDNVNWNFVLAILLGKIVVFGLVAFVTASTHKPLNLSFAGIYGIFCTQGNDFGLAYPIVASLYGSKRPLYAGYMYLIAPSSLLVTNPLGFFLIEAQRARSAENLNSKNKSIVSTIGRTVVSVSWNVFRNPVVVVTVLGIIGNFLFRNGLPSLLYGILQILSSAFSAAVLFLLGFSVVRCGNGKSNSKEGLLVPAMLIVAKMLISPLVTRSFVAVLCAYAPDIDDLEDYGFLYGMVPTGPIVILFAAEYYIKTEMMASTMVVCTALFGPAIFVLARMLTLKVRGIEQFAEELKMTMLILSVFSALCCVWTGLCFILGKKLKNRLPKTISFLILSQLILSVGIFLWATIEKDFAWTAFMKVALVAAGQLMARLWITLLALTLMVNQTNKQSPFIQNMLWPMSFGFGIPAASVIMLLVLTAVGNCEPELHKELPLFIYGTSEAVASIVVLLACLSVTTTSLILYYRSHSHSFDQCSLEKVTDSPAVNSGHELKQNLPSADDIIKGAELAVNKLTKSSSFACVEDCKNVSLKNTDSLPKMHPLHDKEKTFFKENQMCFGKKESYRSSLDIISLTSDSRSASPFSEESDYETERELKTSRHLRVVVLLILGCISMALGLTVSTWKLSSNNTNGVFVAMEFLDAVLNVAQGIFISIIFWRESKYIIDPVMKCLRKVRRGFYQLEDDAVDDSTSQLCRQFRRYHLDNCRRDLPKTLTYNRRSYTNCFTGGEFVSWIIEVGLANHRTTAEVYGQRLMRGGLLMSSNEAVQFHDSNYYFYQLKD